MSFAYDQYSKLMAASEISVVNKYFREWLKHRNVVTRVSCNVLLDELSEFSKEMMSRYQHTGTFGSLLDPLTVCNHVDNILRDIHSEGLIKFCEYARETIGLCGSNRITLNKFLNQMDIYAEGSFQIAVKESVR